jgi:hypothetical protein
MLPDAVHIALKRLPPAAIDEVTRMLDEIQIQDAELVDVYVTKYSGGDYWSVKARLEGETGKTFRQLSPSNNGPLHWKAATAPAAGIPLYLSDLLPRFSNARVIVCEGEKAVHSLNHYFKQAGCLSEYFAVTSGSAQSALGADWSSLAGRDVYVFPDNDEPGRQYGIAVIKCLESVADAVRLIDSSFLPPGGDAFEWCLMQGQPSHVAIAELLGDPQTVLTPALVQPMALHVTTTTLPSVTPSLCPYPVSALGKFALVVSRLSQITSIPPEIFGTSILTVGATACQGQINVLGPFGEVPTSLFALVSLRSGGGKSIAADLAARPMHDYENEITAAGQAMENAITIEDVTVDGMTTSLINGRPSQMLLATEAGVLFGGHAMNKDNRLRCVCLCSNVWSGSPIQRTRVKERTRGVDRRLSMALYAQFSVAQKILTPEFLEQGFLNRFLMIKSDLPAGGRVLPAQGQSIQQDPFYVEYRRDMRQLFEIKLPYCAKTGGVAPRIVSLSSEAYEGWGAEWQRIETASAPGGAYEDNPAYAARMSEQNLRIAGVLAFFEDPLVTEISSEIMARAVELGRYYLHQAMSMLPPEEVEDASEEDGTAKVLLKWLRMSPSPIALRDVYRNVSPKKLRQSDLVRKLMKNLIAQGKVAQHPEQLTDKDGKASLENYTVVCNA